VYPSVLKLFVFCYNILIIYSINSNRGIENGNRKIAK
jgi:hypothetical protein